MDRTELVQALESFPRRADQALPALLLVQRAYGSVPDWAIEQIALHIRRTASDVEGVATGYPDLRRAPAAHHTISICTGAACLAAGACGFLRRVAEESGLSSDSPSAPSSLAVEESDCLFACGVAPVIEFDGVLFGRIEAAELTSLVMTLIADEASATGSEAEP